MLVSFMSTPLDQTKLEQGDICPPEGAGIPLALASGRWCSMTAHTPVGVGLRNHVSCATLLEH